MKSRVVLEILKLGYNLLMSDVDVYWFKNPLPLLTTFGPAVFLAQSDEYKITGLCSKQYLFINYHLLKLKLHKFFYNLDGSSKRLNFEKTHTI